MADSRQAHPSGRQGEPLCISVSGIVTSGWLPPGSRHSAELSFARSISETLSARRNWCLPYMRCCSSRPYVIKDLVHPSSGHGNRRLSARLAFACWVISVVEPSLSKLFVWDVAGFGCLGFTDTNSPFTGLSAIHLTWLSCGIPERRDQNKQVMVALTLAAVISKLDKLLMPFHLLLFVFTGVLS